MTSYIADIDKIPIFFISQTLKSFVMLNYIPIWYIPWHNFGIYFILFP